MTVRTNLFVLAHDETAMMASGGLNFPEGRSACQAARGSDGIGCETVGADRAAEPFGEMFTSSMLTGCLVNNFPGGFFQLQGFDILSDIIDAIDQGEGVS